MDKTRGLRLHAKGLLAILILQYALGMYTNLFVEFPQTPDIHARWVYAMSVPPVAAHVALGTLLLFGAVALLIRTAKLQTQAWKIPGYLGLLGVLIAWLSGERFVSTQTNIFSYLMSLGFLLAVFGYGWGLAKKD